MTDFTPVSALAGGALIGLSASLLMLFSGRIAGISGILGGLLVGKADEEFAWRACFIGGLLGGAFLVGRFTDLAPPIEIDTSLPLVVLGGLLVGFGTRLGSGCTSGHGVCGLARLSPRSLAATLLFMAAAAVVVFTLRHLIGA